MSFADYDRGAPQMESSKSILKPYPDPMMTLGCHHTPGLRAPALTNMLKPRLENLIIVSGNIRPE